jgi:N-acetyl sugar amidotransferase
VTADSVDSAQTICRRCIFDKAVPGIRFDEEGICNYCRLSEHLEAEYKTGTPEGERTFRGIVEEIQQAGKGRKYDCVVGVSGGTDSSYLLHMAIEFGLRPLAVHYDNTWNSAISTENIRKMTRQLKVDLYTHVVDNKEMDDIYRAFLKASVPAIDVPTDIALTEVLYRAASKHSLKYILEGHSFRAEGVSPVGYSYFDGKYIESVHRRFGTRRMRTFPNMKMAAFLKWILVKRIKKVRPLWYLPYSKEKAREFLVQRFNWEYYGGHHLENRMTAFSFSYHNRVKFGLDLRNNSLSASVRSGQMTREEARAIYARPPDVDVELIEYVKKRLGYSDAAFAAMMAEPARQFSDFETYKRTFERMRPFFWVMLRFGLVTKSFYLKYCKPVQ